MRDNYVKANYTLTDKKCKSAKPKDKAYRLFDGGGLYLEVRPSGKKIFRFKYKNKTYTIGEYPIVTLAEARDYVNKVKKQLYLGIDIRNKGLSLEEVVKEFLALKEQEWGEKHYKINKSRLEYYILPFLGNTNSHIFTKGCKYMRIGIIKHEGLKLKPYICPAGHLTIGVGRNLDDLGISEGEAMYLLENDIKRCEKELREIFPKYDELPEQVKMVLIDMDFNLGKTRFLTFKKMIQAVKEHNWEAMIREMKNSKWCRQVKSRCEDDIKLIEELLTIQTF